MSASTRRRTKFSQFESTKSEEQRVTQGENLRSEPMLGKAPHYDQVPWTPAAYTAFKIVLSSRLFAAVWNIVGDCDETYNYWEPMHYLLYGKGFQTWEYSPEYALRSYAYLWLHALPLHIYQMLFGANKILQFYLLRCIMALVCSVSEIYFYRGVCKQFGNNVGRIVLVMLVFSAGMFISSTAFLPSSFAMYLTFISMAGWFHGHYHVAIMSTAASAILGWPFAGAIGIPIALDVLFIKQKWKFFAIWCAIGLLSFLVPMIQVDSYYYGKFVLAPLNIVTYNVFTSHGPDLYGVEPLSYYIMNGFLNFNIAFFLALISLPLIMGVKMFLKIKKTDIPIWLSLLPMYIWIIIFFTRPHKEERFLFPIYPFFLLCGTLTIDILQRVFSHVMYRRSINHYTDNTNLLSLGACLMFSLLSVARIAAVYQGYHAPLDVYIELNKIAADTKIHTLPADKPVNVCVGKEWYRFPSSFFMPAENWNLQFVKSDFKGQLPQPYETGSESTRVIPEHFNDLNKEEDSRYIDVRKCHYMIDLDLQQETPLEPRYSHLKDEWKILYSIEFLDASRSHRFFRAFFIPFISSKYSTYVNYNILKTKRTKRKS